MEFSVCAPFYRNVFVVFFGFRTTAGCFCFALPLRTVCISLLLRYLASIVLALSVALSAKKDPNKRDVKVYHKRGQSRVKVRDIFPFSDQN